jgi:Zn finger protein HypA/HybF involved in hydrogenase expression
MKKSRILCPKCMKSNLIQKTETKLYCSKCKQRYTKNTDGYELKFDNN